MGDTAQSDILVHARVDIAAAMIITLPDPRTTRMVIENIRLAPGQPSSHAAAATSRSGSSKKPVPTTWSTRKTPWAYTWHGKCATIFPTDLIWFWPVD